MPFGIAFGPDGDLWFTEYEGDKIGKVSPTTGAIPEYAIPTADRVPEGITAGPDGDLWFTESGANLIDGPLDPRDAIGKINPTTGAVTEYPVPTVGSLPESIAAGPDGNLWFSEAGSDKIGKIDPTTGAITEYPIPTALSWPRGIAAGPHGGLWFTEFDGNKIGKISAGVQAEK